MKVLCEPLLFSGRTIRGDHEAGVSTIMDCDRILVTDFDGTVTQRDFYSCAVDSLLTPEDLQPWNDYTAGKITHFESLRRIFARIRGPEAQVHNLLPSMRFDADAPQSVETLRVHRWETLIVSNGCDWYIRHLLRQHQMDNIGIELHTSPAVYSPTEGLQMRLPRDSPYFSEQTGVSKTRVVQAMQQRYDEVAFAGDGRPDLEPALMVPPKFRFARGWLAETLQSRGEAYHPFEVWSEIATKLCA